MNDTLFTTLFKTNALPFIHRYQINYLYFLLILLCRLKPLIAYLEAPKLASMGESKWNRSLWLYRDLHNWSGPFCLHGDMPTCAHWCVPSRGNMAAEGKFGGRHWKRQEFVMEVLPELLVAQHSASAMLHLVYAVLEDRRRVDSRMALVSDGREDIPLLALGYLR